MLNLCSFLHKTDTIEKEIRKIFNIPGEKETRLWNKYMSNTFEPLNKPDSTIQDAGLYQGQVQWNTIFFLEYIYLFAHENVAVPNDFCFFLNEYHFLIIMLGIEDFVNEFVEIEAVFMCILGIKDWKERVKRGFNSPGELKFLIYF